MQKKKINNDKISLVIPCYNEEASLPFLVEELNKLHKKMDDVKFEVIFVDNCSNDNTLKEMKKLHEEDARYNYISFSRNFGKDASMYAGMKASTGDYVVIMDADLQDPPQLLNDMYRILKEEDYDVVATYRKNRRHEPLLRKLAANMFYSVINKVADFSLVSGARDFRIMKRQVVLETLRLTETERFTRGIFAWLGFRVKWIPFDDCERVAGKTKLPFKNAFDYAIKGIFGFSKLPLSIMMWGGLLYAFISLACLIYMAISGNPIVISNKVILINSLICFSFLFLFLGIISQYIWQIFLASKKRPLYVIRETNLDKFKLY